MAALSEPCPKRPRLLRCPATIFVTRKHCDCEIRPCGLEPHSRLVKSVCSKTLDDEEQDIVLTVQPEPFKQNVEGRVKLGSLR